MARKTVILVLAVLVAAAAALTQRESAHYVHTMFAVPSGRQNSEKVFEFLAPVINATGEIFMSTLTGVTGILEVITDVLTGQPIASKTAGGSVIYLISKTPETQAPSPMD